MAPLSEPSLPGEPSVPTCRTPDTHAGEPLTTNPVIGSKL
jgi:hypothetical protein